MKKYLFALVIVTLIIIGLGLVYSKQNKSVVNSFVNSDGGYSLEYPSIWKVAINKYNNKNSLFGPDADSGSGLGGVEIFDSFKTVDDFLNGTEAQYSGKTDIIVGGLPAVRTTYKAAGNRQGVQVTLLKDSKIYGIYLNSINKSDLQIFDQIISSFKFTK